MCPGMIWMRVEREWCWEREPTESSMQPGESSTNLFSPHVRNDPAEEETNSSSKRLLVMYS